MKSIMFRIRVLASRQAWMQYRNASRADQPRMLGRYHRIVAYECRRNGTERYTPYWAVAA